MIHFHYVFHNSLCCFYFLTANVIPRTVKYTQQLCESAYDYKYTKTNAIHISSDYIQIIELKSIIAEQIPGEKRTRRLKNYNDKQRIYDFFEYLEICILRP